MALMAPIAKVRAATPARMGELWERMLSYVLVVAVPMSLVAGLLSRPLLLIQANGFIEALPAAWMTVAGSCFTFLSAVMFPFVVAVDAQRRLTRIILIGITVKVALNLVLVPVLGFKGAAIAFLASEVLMFAFLALLLSRLLEHKFSLARFGIAPLGAYLTALAAMFFLARPLLTGSDVVPVTTALGQAAILCVIVLAAYILYSFLLKLVDKAGLRRLNELLEARTEAVGP